MFLEIRDKAVFKKAQEYSFNYLEHVFERNVYPTEEALRNVSEFDEDLPVSTSEAVDVIDRLHTFGSPATVTTLKALRETGCSIRRQVTLN